LQEELSIYADLGTLPVRKLVGALNSVHAAVDKLKSYILAHPFTGVAEEVQFFKYDKPGFVAEQFYAMEIFTIETAKPLNDMELLKTFYEQELNYVRRFLEQHKFLYAYYQFDMKELDRLLFVRGAKPADIPVPETSGLDPLFATCCDTLWGKFMAFERLAEWLRMELRSLESGGGQAGGEQPVAPAGGPGGLRWTGETINLAELAYGIWLTGQVNHGQVSITEIMEFLEAVFRVRVGKPHRRWQSLTRRKRVGAFRFVDEVKAALEKRLEEELGL